MTLAVIDIGTNTVLLLVARFDNKGNIATLAYEQRVPRLGKGVDASKKLHPDSMNKVIRVLDEFKILMKDFPIETIVVAGTSAVRDAGNREEFSRLIRNKTGFELEVLSGSEEALWTYRGAISGVDNLGNATVVDIGGGSTEITTGDATTVNQNVSFNMGSIRLTERFFQHDPPTEAEVDAATDFVRKTVAGSGQFDFSGSSLMGVAGTATSLALLDQEIKTFSITAVRNYCLTLDRVNILFRRLRRMSSPEILNLSTVMQGRSDVITAGTLILSELMALFGFGSMIVSERGVRYGLAIREWERKFGRN